MCVIVMCDIADVPLSNLRRQSIQEISHHWSISHSGNSEQWYCRFDLGFLVAILVMQIKICFKKLYCGLLLELTMQRKLDVIISALALLL